MAKFLNPEEMTSRDYYFDSYAHFGIHEVRLVIAVWMKITYANQSALWINKAFFNKQGILISIIAAAHFTEPEHAMPLCTCN